MSKMRSLKVASFVGTLPAVQAAVNNFTAGKALTSGDSGTVAYAAGFVAEKTLIDQVYAFDGTAHAIVLFYLE